MGDYYHIPLELETSESLLYEYVFRCYSSIEIFKNIFWGMSSAHDHFVPFFDKTTTSGPEALDEGHFLR